MWFRILLRRERFFFFFFKGLTRSTLTWSTYSTGLIGPLGLPGDPRRATRQPRAYKRPLGPFLAHFSSPLYSSLSTKFPRALRALQAVLSTLVCHFSKLFLSILHLRSMSIFFFCKMLVAVLLEMHASVYFYFWNFLKHIFCHDFCHVILGKMHVYIFFAFAIWLQTCRNLDAKNKVGHRWGDLPNIECEHMTRPLSPTID